MRIIISPDDIEIQAEGRDISTRPQIVDALIEGAARLTRLAVAIVEGKPTQVKCD